VLFAKYRSVRVPPARIAHRLAAIPAVGRGWRFRVILAIHNVSLNVNLPDGPLLARRRLLLVRFPDWS
jgi:hypothetical protein